MGEAGSKSSVLLEFASVADVMLHLHKNYTKYPVVLTQYIFSRLISY